MDDIFTRFLTLSIHLYDLDRSIEICLSHMDTIIEKYGLLGVIFFDQFFDLSRFISIASDHYFINKIPESCEIDLDLLKFLITRCKNHHL